MFVYEGNDVSLTCEAEGSPPPVFNWTKDGVDMWDSTNNLNITQVITSATYQCVASNDLGSITKQIHVHVIKTSWTATPAAMTTPEASAQTGTVCILISFTLVYTNICSAVHQDEALIECSCFWMAGCPLILMPAEVVVRFGDPVSINCSTSATDFWGMGWEVAFGGTGFTNLSAVTWTVEKLRDWTIQAKCYVTLIDNQCFEMPNITLYSEYKSTDCLLSSWQGDYPTKCLTEGCKVTMSTADRNSLCYIYSAKSKAK